MANNTVTISGMFGDGHTYFVDSPVVIDISELDFPQSSPFKVVRVEVVYESKVVGEFRADTGGQSSISFDISSALRAIWSGYDYDNNEVAATTSSSGSFKRSMRPYILRIYTEYLADDGLYTETQCKDKKTGSTDITGGMCLMGGMTEFERSLITDNERKDVASFQNSNNRNGDASTKPTSTPERVGSDSFTSWVDVGENEGVGYTKSVFYKNNDGEADDTGEHAPIVIRDSQPYVDFLFTNRRGAVETCSGMMKEAMSVNVDMKQYSRSERPNFKPTRSLMAIGTDGRRSWQMSSGYVTREWAQWWAMEFLGGKRKLWWMRLKYGDKQEKWVPVTIKPAKSETTIYDKTKQQMAHVDFTVTMALEG